MIVLVTDAAPPQVNGVVVTIMNTAQQLRQLGHEVELITPADFRTIPMPLYRGIPVAIFPHATCDSAWRRSRSRSRQNR